MPDADSLAASSSPEAPPWWRTAVVYQVYIRSFADGDGDGLGDIAGPSRAHGASDRSRRRRRSGSTPGTHRRCATRGTTSPTTARSSRRSATLADAEALIAEAHQAGLKVILDIVPNHTSSDHAGSRPRWRGDAAAARRATSSAPAAGPSGDEPPNDWQSTFGGPAWTRTKDVDGQPGDWYLHLFAPEQPDLDWTNPEVAAEFEDILRFWFDRDGRRFPDRRRPRTRQGRRAARCARPAQPRSRSSAPHPAWDQDGVHEVYRRGVQIADSYDPPRLFVAEAWVANNDRLARYLRPDELHTAFQFDFLRAPWQADQLRRVIDDAMSTADAVGAQQHVGAVEPRRRPPRHSLRPIAARPSGGERLGSRAVDCDEPADLELGDCDARARPALLALALPGVAYIYQGEELGLEEVEDLPGELRQDPTWWQSDYTNPGRDGCRVPLPWSGAAHRFGFSPDDAAAASVAAATRPLGRSSRSRNKTSIPTRR